MRLPHPIQRTIEPISTGNDGAAGALPIFSSGHIPDKRDATPFAHAQSWHRSVEVTGLLDTGATVSVLPYSVGQALGADWDSQTTTVHLTGTLGQIEARALVLMASHPDLTPHGPVLLAFAWTRVEETPVIFGQTNFFMEFDVCFYRSQSMFEVHPHRG